MVQWMMVPLLFLPVHNIEEKDKFRLFVQYRGKYTEQYARALQNLQAPCKVILTLRKLKTLLTPLKPPVELLMETDVIYQIISLRCQVRYVGKTDQHLITCFKEHRERVALPVTVHFADCILMVKEEDIVILASTNKNVPHLYT